MMRAARNGTSGTGWGAFALVCTMTVYGCGHAKKVEDPNGAERGANEQKRSDKQDDDRKPRDRGGAADGQEDGQQDGQPAKAGDRTKDDDGKAGEAASAGGDGEAASKKNDTEQKVPIAPAPGRLMAEGSIKELQGSLQKAGVLPRGKKHVTGRLDAPTEQALRKFQEKNDLPATGVPDRATAQALGLDADELFKSAE